MNRLETNFPDRQAPNIIIWKRSTKAIPLYFYNTINMLDHQQNAQIVINKITSAIKITKKDFCQAQWFERKCKLAKRNVEILRVHQLVPG